MKDIRLRAVNQDPDSEDSRLMWSWRKDQHTREMSLSTDPISWSEHHRWYEEAEKNPKRHLWMIEVKDTQKWHPCGVIRLDETSHQAAYLSLNIDPKWRRQGIARAGLMKIIPFARFLNLKTVDALIKKSNVASIHLFTSLGFTHTEDLALEEKQLERYRWLVKHDLT